MAYTVGEMARRLGVPASTIRYYDKEGLLPFVGRSSGGIRVFTEKDFEWLRIIECLKKTGMSLKDIREYIELAMQGDETIARRLELSPVPMIIAIAVSSNLQGAATLVGDTTSILLGGYAGMNFVDFFVWQGKMGMFFIVQLGALLSAAVLLWLFRREERPVVSSQRAEVTDYFPSFLLLGMIVLLITASFLPEMPSYINGLICMALLLTGTLRGLVRSGKGVPRAVLREIDWQTILLLAGLFLVIGGIKEQGVIDALARIIAGLGGGNLFLVYTIVVWASVLLSAFIDNIPYVATMLPVVQGIAQTMGVDPTLLYFGLLSGATLGGNLTPIGASANITGIGILRRAGCEVKNADFLRIGIPFTLAAVTPAYLIIWLLYA